MGRRGGNSIGGVLVMARSRAGEWMRALVLRWAAYLERYGEPPPLPGGPRLATPWRPELHHDRHRPELPPLDDPPAR